MRTLGGEMTATADPRAELARRSVEPMVPASLRWVLAAVVVGLVCLGVSVAPRFARHGAPGTTFGPVYVTPDGDSYTELVIDQVEYFRATDAFAGRGTDPVAAPFTRRFLVPRLAALLPWDPPISINVVNVAFLGAGLVALVALTRRWVRRGWILVGLAAAYATSFPAWWYGGSNWVDSATVGLIAVAVWAGFRRWWAGAALTAVAVMAKESALVLVPFGVCLELLRPAVGQRLAADGGVTSRAAAWARAARTAAWPAAALGGLTVAAVVGANARLTFGPWIPDSAGGALRNVATNLSDTHGFPRVAATSVAVVVGLVWCARQIRRGGCNGLRHLLWPLWTGVFASLGLAIWALLGAYWDGRTAWHAFPFALPLVAICIDRRLDRVPVGARTRRLVRATAWAAAWLALAVGTMDGSLQWNRFPFVVIAVALVVDRLLARAEPPGAVRSWSRTAAWALGSLPVVFACYVSASLLLSAVGGLITVPETTATDPHIRFADHLDTVPRFVDEWVHPSGSQVVRFTWEGRHEIASGIPVLMDYKASPGGDFALRYVNRRGDVIGDITARPEGGEGTVLVDLPPDATGVEVDGTGWAVRARSIETGFIWDRNTTLAGEGDQVLLMPGGTTALKRLRLHSADPDAGVGFVGSEPFDLAVSPEAVMPAGTEVVVIRADGAWRLTSSNSLELPDGSG